MTQRDKDQSPTFTKSLVVFQITAINYHGHPTLRLPLPSTPPPRLRTETLDDVPFAIATLLVRNHEVVALGISGANIVAMQQPMVGTRVSGPDSADEEQ